MPALNWVRQYDKGGSIDLDGGSWDEVWNVYPFTPSSNPAWVDLLTDNPALAPGTVHPTIPGAFVQKFDPKPINTRGTGFEVTVTYGDLDAQERDTPPVDRSPRITLHGETVMEPTLTWANGDPILNTAGDLIFGLEKPVNHWIFHVEAFVSAVPSWSLNYANAVNSDAVNLRGLAVAAEYLTLRNLDVGETDSELIGGTMHAFIPVAFDLVYNPNTWKTKIYSRGLYHVHTASGVRAACLDGEGVPTQEPMFLDANGQVLPYPPDVSVPTFIASLHTIEGWNHLLMPFSVLPLT